VTADVPGAGAGGLAIIEAAASTALAEVLLDLARESEEAGDAAAADLTLWLSGLYARLGDPSVDRADEEAEDAPEHAYETEVMLRVAARVDERSAYLRGEALDPTNTVAFLAARSAEALVEMLREEAAEGGDE